MWSILRTAGYPLLHQVLETKRSLPFGAAFHPPVPRGWVGGMEVSQERNSNICDDESLKR